MRTAGLNMNEVWASRALREAGVSTQAWDDVPAEIGVLVDQAELKHHSADQQFRPYLHISGQLQSITPETQLPYDIDEIVYAEGQGERVDAFYEFDRDQLSQLVLRGYFNPGFQAPEMITGIVWQLPAQVDVLIMDPLDPTRDAPVVFTRVHDGASLALSLESSEYDLVAYFPQHEARQRDMQQPQITSAAVPNRVSDAQLGETKSLFTAADLGIDLVDPESAVSESSGEHAEAQQVAGAMQQVEEELDAAAEQYRTELSHTPGTIENLYQEHVVEKMQEDAPAAGGASEPVVDAEAVTTSGLADTRAEVTVAEVDAVKRGQFRHVPTIEERKRDIAARAASLEYADDEQELES